MPIVKNRFPEIIAALPVRLDAAVEAAANVIMEQAKENVPVETGRLRDAIHVEEVGNLKRSVTAGDREAFYGHIVEHGSVHSGARPFLIPAFEQSKDDVIEIVDAVLRAL